jgi:hypothetical protein
MAFSKDHSPKIDQKQGFLPSQRRHYLVQETASKLVFLAQKTIVEQKSNIVEQKSTKG